jgi:hypothetical protein
MGLKPHKPSDYPSFLLYVLDEVSVSSRSTDCSLYYTTSSISNFLRTESLQSEEARCSKRDILPCWLVLTTPDSFDGYGVDGFLYSVDEISTFSLLCPGRSGLKLRRYVLTIVIALPRSPTFASAFQIISISSPDSINARSHNCSSVTSHYSTPLKPT